MDSTPTAGPPDDSGGAALSPSPTDETQTPARVDTNGSPQPSESKHQSQPDQEEEEDVQDTEEHLELELQRRAALIARLQEAEARNNDLRGKLVTARRSHEAEAQKQTLEVKQAQDHVDELSTPALPTAAAAAGGESKEAEVPQLTKKERKALEEERQQRTAVLTAKRNNKQACVRTLRTLEACEYMSTTNCNLRAAMASLLKQQEHLVGHLSGLTEKDRAAADELVRERFMRADEDEMLERQFELGPTPQEREKELVESVPTLCPVNPASLTTEWARVFGGEAKADHLSTADGTPEHGSLGAAAAAEQPPSPITPQPLPPMDDKAAVTFIVKALELNRGLYVDAISKPQDFNDMDDCKANMGFSSGQMPGYEYEFDEEDSADNIVYAGGRKQDDNKEPQIKCATLNKLVERMTLENKQDLNVRYTFLLTYQSFTTPKEFLEILSARYFLPMPPNLTPEEITYFIRHRLAPVQIKVFGVLKKWLEEHYNDFADDDELRGKLKATIHSFIERSSGPWVEKSAKSLLKLVERQEAGGVKQISRSMDYPPPKLAPSITTLDQFKLLDCHPLEIARQLTMLDWNAFKKIQSREFLNQSWNKADKEEKAPHIVRMISRFNEVVAWVQTVILGSNVAETRSRLLIKFLKVGKHLRNMNNFHSGFAIYAGINSTPIHRLRKTWELLPSKQTERFQSFVDMFSAHNNWKNFRRILQRAITPCIPHIGLFLADLTFIEDGNPDKLNGMINFHKRRMLAERIMWIKQYQQTAYRFQELSVIQQYFQRHTDIVDEDTLYALSIAIEPRIKNPPTH